MKKILTFVLTLALVFFVGNTTIAFAVTPEAVGNFSTTSTNASNSVSGEMDGGETVYSVQLNNVGTNPTFTFSISGRPNLYVDVIAVSPLGTRFTLFSNIPCDGSTYSQYHFSMVSGTYFFTIMVNHGSTVGEKNLIKLQLRGKK